MTLKKKQTDWAYEPERTFGINKNKKNFGVEAALSEIDRALTLPYTTPKHW